MELLAHRSSVFQEYSSSLLQCSWEFVELLRRWGSGLQWIHVARSHHIRSLPSLILLPHACCPSLVYAVVSRFTLMHSCMHWHECLQCVRASEFCFLFMVVLPAFPSMSVWADLACMRMLSSSRSSAFQLQQHEHAFFQPFSEPLACDVS